MKIIEIPGFDIPPIQIFENIFEDKPYPFLLESSMALPDYGRYSIMGSDPFLRFKSKGRSIQLFENGKVKSFNDNPFNALKDLFDSYRRLSTVDCGLPFTGGAVGYFGYDLGKQIEKLPDTAKDDLKLPDCYLCFYKNTIVIDHLRCKTYISGPKSKEFANSLLSLKNNLKSGDLSHFENKKSQKNTEQTLKDNIINIAKIKQLLRKLNFGGNRETEIHILDIETSLARLQLILLDKNREGK